MNNLEMKILRASHLAEESGRDDEAFKLVAMLREISAARQTEVKIDSWDDFSAWWEANRSQHLLFSLQDTLGKDNPVIGQLAEIMKKQEELDKSLHEVYISLRGAPKPKQQQKKEEPAPAPAPEKEPNMEDLEHQLEEEGKGEKKEE